MNIYIDLDGTLIDVYERYCGILNLYLKNIDSEIFFSTEDYKYYRQSGYSDLKMAMEKGLPSVNENDYRKFKHRFLENLEWLKKDKIIENPKEIKKYAYKEKDVTELIKVYKIKSEKYTKKAIDIAKKYGSDIQAAQPDYKVRIASNSETSSNKVSVKSSGSTKD